MIRSKRCVDIGRSLPVNHDSREFRNALGAFPTGVIVLTAKARGRYPIGMTLSSFNSVSLNPPLVLFSIHCDAYGLLDLLEIDRYGINVLRADQHHVSDRFAKAGTDKWSGVETRIGRSGCLLLADPLATFECAPYSTHEGGDHVIFVASVMHFEANPAADALVFFRGCYAKVAPSSI